MSTRELMDAIDRSLARAELDAVTMVQDLTVTGGYMLPKEIAQVRKLLGVLRKDYDDAYGGVCTCGRQRPAHSPVCWLCHATGGLL